MEKKDYIRGFRDGAMWLFGKIDVEKVKELTLNDFNNMLGELEQEIKDVEKKYS